MKLINILTTVKDLQPGDTWEEAGTICVVHLVEPSETEPYQYDVHYVRINSSLGSYTKQVGTWFGSDRFVCNR